MSIDHRTLRSIQRPHEEQGASTQGRPGQEPCPGVLSWRTDYSSLTPGASGHHKASSTAPTSPFDPKEGSGVESKEKSPVGPGLGIDSPKAKAAQRLHLFPWRRDWRSKGTKQSEKHKPVTTFRASVIDGRPEPRQEDIGRIKGNQKI